MSPFANPQLSDTRALIPEQIRISGLVALNCKYHREKKQEGSYYKETYFALALLSHLIKMLAFQESHLGFWKPQQHQWNIEKKSRAPPPLGTSFPWRSREASLNDSKLRIVDLHASLKPLCDLHFRVVIACLQGHLGYLPRWLQTSKLDLVFVHWRLHMLPPGKEGEEERAGFTELLKLKPTSSPVCTAETASAGLAFSWHCLGSLEMKQRDGSPTASHLTLPALAGRAVFRSHTAAGSTEHILSARFWIGEACFKYPCLSFSPDQINQNPWGWALGITTQLHL